MKLGLGQINTKWMDVDNNKEHILKLVKEAKEQHCRAIFFAEMCLTGFSSDAQRLLDKISYQEALEFFMKAAKDNELYIGFGAVEGSEGSNYNCYTVLSPEGEMVNKYHKIHSFSPGSEDKTFSSGNEIHTFTIDDLKLSTLICYDLRFPEIFQIASMSSDLILVPASWPEIRSTHWLTLLKARAIENQCFIAGINSYGYDENNYYYGGHTTLIDPLGNALDECSDKESLLTFEVKPEEVAAVRRKFNVKKDRRPEVYLKYYKELI